MITVIALLVVIVIIAGLLTHFLHKDDDDFPFLPPTTYTKEELSNIKLAEELYNKDLRPVATKKAKAKPAPELEVVEPEFVAKVVEIAKVLPPEATINAEALVETAKPLKKKRKYYPKNKK